MRAGGDQRHENLPPTVVTGAAFTATVALLLVLLLVLLLAVLLLLLLLLLLLRLWAPPSPRRMFSFSFPRFLSLLGFGFSLVVRC